MAAACLVTCWNCLGEFDALGAAWCSDDPENPTKLCPFCLRCSCEAATECKPAYWQQSNPDSVLDYLLALGARKRASDVSLEPRPEHVAVRYRIDGFAFRVDPLPKTFEAWLERALFAMFGLHPARRGRPQTGRTTARLGEGGRFRPRHPDGAGDPGRQRHHPDRGARAVDDGRGATGRGGGGPAGAEDRGHDLRRVRAASALRRARPWNTGR